MRRYEWLAKMHRMEAKAAMEMATKLRLTNQSRWQATRLRQQRPRLRGAATCPVGYGLCQESVKPVVEEDLKLPDRAEVEYQVV